MSPKRLLTLNKQLQDNQECLRIIPAEYINWEKTLKINIDPRLRQSQDISSVKKYN